MPAFHAGRSIGRRDISPALPDFRRPAFARRAPPGQAPALSPRGRPNTGGTSVATTSNGLMRNPFRRDLVLVHPPAIYDFRTREAFLGPVADAVPSTAIFEMYPVGMTSIAAFLERNHYNVQIVNLACRMLREPSLDVPACLAAIDAPVVGLDLHWLPHAQGALAVAALLKTLHPSVKVLLGGLSASYYHDELARHPDVDFVIRGDSAEEPVRQLLQALREGRPLDAVENLTWKRADGSVAANPLTFVPETLDYVDVPAYDYVLRSIFKYGSLDNLLPTLDWLRQPITLLLSARGCAHECVICGGSRSAYRRICGRSRPAFRSPDKLAEDVRRIASFSRAPIFMVHDPRMAGMQSTARFFSLLEEIRPPNEMIFELYAPADDRFFDVVERSVPAWSLEITLESPDEQLRRLNGKFPFTNEAVERTIASALAHGCRTVDVFFMIGLPHQTRDAALAIPEYCEHLIGLGSPGRIRPFVAPLGPFLDPGSRAFEEPDFGYRRFCWTLADHCRAALQPTWPEILSYETDGMTREEIARATYDVAERLNAIKRRHGLIDGETADGVASRLRVARQLLETARHTPRPSHAAVEMANHGTMFGDNELKWPVAHRFRIGTTLLRSLAAGLGQEIVHTAARMMGRYDTAALRSLKAEV
jgi:B12-binding domain/radical SAM domain protein